MEKGRQKEPQGAADERGRERDRLPLVATGGLIVVALVQIGAAMLPPPPRESVIPRPPTLPSESVFAPITAEVVEAHPLFAPDRAPVRTASAPASAEAPQTFEGMTLQGIGVAGSAVSAVVRMSDGKSRRLKVGDRVGEWTLSQAAARALTFERGEDRRVVLLDPRKLRQSGAFPGTPAPGKGGHANLSSASPSSFPPSVSDEIDGEN